MKEADANPRSRSSRRSMNGSRRVSSRMIAVGMHKAAATVA